MQGPYVGSIDEGTTSARFIIFKAGTDEIICYHQIDVTQIFPQEGWCEQDPDEIYNIVITCMEEAVKKLKNLGGNPEDMIAIGIANQRESSIVWNRTTGEPLHNAIIWLDMRTSTTVDQLLETTPNNSKNQNYLKPLCGLPISTYFSALKVRWLKDNVPSVKQAMDNNNCLFGTVDTWLLWKLTGGINGGIHVTDVTNASRTMLMNIETLRWDPHLLKFFDLPASILPEIKSSSEIYGSIKGLNVLNGVPLSGCLGDQQAALVGQNCFSRGQAKNTYGTGCFLLYNTGNSIVHSTQGLLTTVGYQFGPNAAPVYALEGSVAIAGAAVSWLRDNISLFDTFNELQELAESVDNTGDVYFVPAFSGLYAPYWNQEARAVICGLSEETTRAHIIRATLEAVCFQVRDILDAMNRDCGIPLTKLKVDGGMTKNDLLMQLQADLIGIPVIRAKVAETTALGAALAAYYAIANKEPDAQDSLVVPSNVFKTNINQDQRDIRYAKWKMAIERSFGWESSDPVLRKLIRDDD